MITQRRAKRKPSGGRYKSDRVKKLKEEGRAPALTKVGDTKLKLVRVRGGNYKKKLLSADTANVYDTKSKKCVKAKIKSVVESPANVNYVRRNIIVKGTVVETDKGKAKITSRPGQDGTINAILIS